MCGILGSVNIAFNKEDLKTIAHRGPDSSSLTVAQVAAHQITFGHTRLAIQDLSESGNQPMWSQCNNYCIIFNGEVYNHLELRESLKEVKFKGHSDTETMLYFLIKYGPRSCEKFNGIFSYAFLDKSNRKLYLARDPFGVKPLYYSLFGNRFIFSSEIKAIKPFLPNREIDRSSLYTFLKLRYNPAPSTLYKAVKKLRPGHIMEVDLESELNTHESYYSFKHQSENNLSPNSVIEKYSDLLEKAVKRQLLSDVPVSLLLSGGVDSGLLLALMKKYQEDISSYTVGFAESHDESELTDARYSAELFDTNHHEIKVSATDFFSSFSEMNSIVEEPVGSQSLLPFHALVRQVHMDGFKVALSGQGVDEAWGGYKRYNYQNIFRLLAPMLSPKLRGISNLFTNDKIRRAINASTSENFVDQYIESYSYFDDARIKRLIKNNFSDEEKSGIANELNYRRDILGIEDLSATQQMLLLDMRTNLSDDLLLYTDKIAMKYSLEVRVPFLDIDLIKFVESLPLHFKTTPRKNKILHKEVAKKILPSEIVYRKKKGFYIPRKQWFQSQASLELQNTISKSSHYFSEQFNNHEVKSYFVQHLNGTKNFEDQLFSISNLYYWMENS